VTIDINHAHAEVARKHFEAAGLSDRIETIVGNAQRALDDISSRGPFGFVFIDADKKGYQDYYAWAIEHVRTGGVICAHNAFRGGAIFSADRTADVETTWTFNRAVAGDSRVISTLYPAGDGTLIAVKR
jgi:caffeoyl-CoA O-methyltransferase